MTLYTNRIAFLAPVGHADACNRAANALGRSGLNFSVRLSSDGLEPATHVGGSAVETDLFLHVLSFAPDLPPGMEWPEDLTPEDWWVVVEHLEVKPDPTGSTNPSSQFDDFVGTHNLKRVEYVLPS